MGNRIGGILFHWPTLCIHMIKDNTHKRSASLHENQINEIVWILLVYCVKNYKTFGSVGNNSSPIFPFEI